MIRNAKYSGATRGMESLLPVESALQSHPPRLAYSVSEQTVTEVFLHAIELVTNRLVVEPERSCSSREYAFIPLRMRLHAAPSALSGR